MTTIDILKIAADAAGNNDRGAELSVVIRFIDAAPRWAERAENICRDDCDARRRVTRYRDLIEDVEHAIRFDE